MKPFNLEHAKAGVPVALADGTEATIIKFDGRNEECPLVVLVGGKDRPHLASTKGYVSFGPMNGSKKLVMRPIGTLEGREVYHGDELRHTTPGNGNIVNVTINASQPYMDFTDGVFTERYWSWPAAYPVTQMSDQELCAVCNATQVEFNVTTVANAAIRHGIDNGYLLDPTDATARIEMRKVLTEIAKIAVMLPGWKYTDIPDAIRRHEVALGKHFYNLGTVGACDMWPTLPNQWFEDHMPKVKP